MFTGHAYKSKFHMRWQMHNRHKFDVKRKYTCACCGAQTSWLDEVELTNFLKNNKVKKDYK